MIMTNGRELMASGSATNVVMSFHTLSGAAPSVISTLAVVAGIMCCDEGTLRTRKLAVQNGRTE